MLKEPMPPYQVGSVTNVGKVREENQDSIGYFRTEDGAWLVLTVCDGMGGHAGGKTASSLAVETIGKVFTQEITSSLPEQAIGNAIRKANDAVFTKAADDPALHGMGSTCVLLAVRGDRAYLGHVGDSRIYRIRKGSIERMTRDHSNVQRMVDGGMLSDAQAREHPDSNILYRCLGVKPEVEPEVRGPEKVEKGDRFLLCSDGLHSLVEDQIIAALATMVSPPDAVEKLVSLAIDRGGTDNISVQILHRADGFPASGKFVPDRFERLPRGTVAPQGPTPRPVWTRWPLVIAFVAGLLAGGGLMWLGLHASRPVSAPQGTPTPSQPRPSNVNRIESVPAPKPVKNEDSLMLTIPGSDDQAQTVPGTPPSVPSPSVQAGDIKSDPTVVAPNAPTRPSPRPATATEKLKTP